MKIRSDFVSNSSSSSFIVISNNGVDETEAIKERFSIYNEADPYRFPCQDYKNQFGWEFENTQDFGGKLNFIGLQLLYLYEMTLSGPSYYYKGNPDSEFQRCIAMIKKVCKEQFGFIAELDTSLVVEHKYVDKNDGGKEKSWFDIKNMYYIDHQSCVTESENMDMFESEGSLIDFLSNDGSYIEGGNDNI